MSLLKKPILERLCWRMVFRAGRRPFLPFHLSIASYTGLRFGRIDHFRARFAIRQQSLERREVPPRLRGRDESDSRAW
jgi:hypothetical protein